LTFSRVLASYINFRCVDNPNYSLCSWQIKNAVSTC